MEAKSPNSGARPKDTALKFINHRMFLIILLSKIDEKDKHKVSFNKIIEEKPQTSKMKGKT